MTQILLVDDHPMIIRGLEGILSDAFADAAFGVAMNAEQALQNLQDQHWDLVIVDLNLPPQGGFHLIRSLKELKPRVPVLIYSMYSEEQFGIRAIQSGADGFLSKDTPMDEIPVAVRALLEGKSYIREGLASVLVNLARGGITSQALSDREEQVLRLIAAGKTPTQIADALALSIKSVGTYRARVLEKLGLQTTAELIRYALDHGYR